MSLHMHRWQPVTFDVPLPVRGIGPFDEPVLVSPGSVRGLVGIRMIPTARGASDEVMEVSLIFVDRRGIPWLYRRTVCASDLWFREERTSSEEWADEADSPIQWQDTIDSRELYRLVVGPAQQVVEGKLHTLPVAIAVRRQLSSLAVKLSWSTTDGPLCAHHAVKYSDLLWKRVAGRPGTIFRGLEGPPYFFELLRLSSVPRELDGVERSPVDIGERPPLPDDTGAQL